MPDWSNVFQVVSADPFLFYTLLAAGFLTVVSLGSGWLRADFVAVMRPQGLLRVTVAVLVAFVVVLLADALQVQTTGSGEVWLEALRGLSRLPLYVVTLAYGPSAGLLAAGLFAAFATSSGLPGWPEAVLALELVVLGWFALAPSPRRVRWAGPLDALLAYFLAWSTGGAALLQGLSGSGTLLAAYLAYHQGAAPGIALSMALLFLVGPGVYDRFFPHSRIVPRPAPPVQADAPDARAEIADSAPQRREVDPGDKRRAAGGRRATDSPAAAKVQRRAGRRKDDPVNLVIPSPTTGANPDDVDAALEPRTDPPPADTLSLESHTDAELVAPRDHSAPSPAAPALRDTPHDVKP